MVSNKLLSLQALSLYEFYIDISDFDYKHYSHGSLTVRFAEISRIFNCSESTIRNWHKELIDVKLISKTDERNIYRLINPQRYALPGFWKGEASQYSRLEKNQPADKILQLMKQEFQSTEQNSQHVEKSSPNNLEKYRSKALGSSKVYSQVGNNTTLTEEDKKWLDNSI
jgi:hypothetical protein